MSISLAEWDWVVLPSWGALHHAAVLPDTFEDDCGGEGQTSCGRKGWLCIPGVLARMGAPRCKRCCKAVGYPDGIGSPKNDDVCAVMVEMRAAGRTIAAIHAAREAVFGG